MSDGAYHPGGVEVCPVAGCGWVLCVDPPVPVVLPHGAGRRIVGAPCEQVEWYLVTHAEWHAANAETGVDPAAHGREGAP